MRDVSERGGAVAMENYQTPHTTKSLGLVLTGGALEELSAPNPGVCVCVLLIHINGPCRMTHSLATIRCVIINP